MTELVDVAGQQRVNLNFGYLYYVTEKMEAQTSRILQNILEVDQVKGEDQNVPDFLKKIDPEVISDQISEVREKEHRYGIKVNFTPNLTPDEVRRRYEDDTNAYANKCFYAWYHARVNPYGDLYACGPISLSMGNVTEQPLSEIWNNETYRAFRKALKRHQLFPKCTKCCALNSKLWTHLPALTK
jgi:radical SAM protein with 4Fe4S-binding SPASM domain